MNIFPVSLLAVTLGVASNASGVANLVWISEIDLKNLRSDGITKLNANTTVDLGVFVGNFVPSEANFPSWQQNWLTLGRTLYNSGDSYFSGQAKLDSNGLVKADTPVYIWVKGESPFPGKEEWFLASNTSIDGNSGDNWLIPTVSETDQTDTPYFYELNSTNAPLLSVLAGATMGDTGAGLRDGNPPEGIQTSRFDAIPEPSSLLAGALGLTLTLAWRRRPGS